jgi:sugar fermentation stimulation protein A
MRFPAPLLRGRLVRRYKRFFAEVVLDSGDAVTAHTPNTGSMLTCAEPGSMAYVSRAVNTRRKLAFTWELAGSSATFPASSRGRPVLVGVNTALANRLVEEAIRAGVIAELAGAQTIRREVCYGRNSRVDLLLEQAGLPPCYVEVKNVTLARQGVAAFPDAVSTRAAKHMAELAAQVRAGYRAAVVFAVQREDCDAMAPADDIDPAYGKALRIAAAAGVLVLACQARVTPEEIVLYRKLPVRL